MPVDTPPKKLRSRFTYLDFGRVLACLMVVAYHAGGTASMPKYFGEHPLSEWVAIGYIRMPFFFAMSGFLMGWLYLRAGSKSTSQTQADAATFLGRRFAHLFPLYWIVLGTVAVVQLFVLRQAEGVPADAWNWIETALLLPQPPEPGSTGAPVLYPAWVLQYELVAYALVALAMSHRALHVIYLVSFPVFFALFHNSDNFILSFIGSKWLLIFWMGAVAARVAPHLDGRSRGVALAAALLWLAGTGGAQYFADSGADASGLKSLDVHYGFAFALLMLFFSGFRRTELPGQRQPMTRQAVQTLSNWSYAIFLCHAPVISLVCKVGVAVGLNGERGWELAVLASMLLSITAGGTLYALVQRPADRWITRSSRNLRGRWARGPVPA